MAFYKTSTRCKARAAEKNLPFDLSGLYIKSLWPKDSKCPIFGTPMHLADGSLDNNSAALDRIVPSRGYVRGNVWFISTLANNIKSDATWPDILRVGLWYHETYLNCGLETGVPPCLLEKVKSIL